MQCILATARGTGLSLAEWSAYTFRFTALHVAVGFFWGAMHDFVECWRDTDIVECWRDTDISVIICEAYVTTVKPKSIVGACGDTASSRTSTASNRWASWASIMPRCLPLLSTFTRLQPYTIVTLWMNRTETAKQTPWETRWNLCKTVVVNLDEM